LALSRQKGNTSFQDTHRANHGCGFVNSRFPRTDAKSWPLRGWAVDLNAPSTLARARVAIPLVAGVVSVALGQDTNWDLYNYHLYNPYAMLNGKLAVDLAPAGLQSYLNPLLDVPYYVATRYLPAPLIGFATGWLHGLVFVLVLGIASRVLLDLPAEDRYRAPLLVALAGCLTANFLSELGNTMGDNTTALLGLAAVLAVVSGWGRLAPWTPGAIRTGVAAGVLVGCAAGLKLTNAIYAVALAAALVSIPSTWPRRLQLIVVYGAGVVLGIALTGGYWFIEMWRSFGNPLFPQFGTLVPSPLATPVTVYDTAWGPRGIVEALLWPFVTALDSKRVGQLNLHQVIWPLMYVLLAAWVAVRLVARARGDPIRPLEPRARFVLVFIVVGYLLWMAVFSIYRYLVTIEVLAPLVVFVLLAQLLRCEAAWRGSLWVLTAVTLVVLAGGVRTWGHESWHYRAFRADLPALLDPSRTTVVLLARDPPLAWLAPLFPRDVAFAGVGGGILDTPAYDAHVRKIVASRGGRAFAIVDGRRESSADNGAIAERAAALYAEHGLALDVDSCSPFAAYAGRRQRTLQWCALAIR